jgi:hypothetical protein
MHWHLCNVAWRRTLFLEGAYHVFHCMSHRTFMTVQTLCRLADVVTAAAAQGLELHQLPPRLLLTWCAAETALAAS